MQLLATAGTLEPLSEQSNVQHRICKSYLETLIGLNLQGALESKPMLATSLRRVSDTTVELSLRPTSSSTMATRSRRGTSRSASVPSGCSQYCPGRHGKTLISDDASRFNSDKALPPQITPVARRLWPSWSRRDRRSAHCPLRQRDTGRDAGGAWTQLGSEIINRRQFESAKSWLEYARAPVGTGPYRVQELYAEPRVGAGGFRRLLGWSHRRRGPGGERAAAARSTRVETPEADGPGTLFAQANATRGAGDLREAAARYNQLERRYPDSPEANVSLVSAGDLLARLGDPAAALDQFDRYLARNVRGALAPEALFGRARCLRELGRRQDEADAWGALFGSFPGSLYNRTARRRLNELRADGPSR